MANLQKMTGRRPFGSYLSKSKSYCKTSHKSFYYREFDHLEILLKLFSYRYN